MSDAREAVLGAIRAQLEGVDPLEEPAGPSPGAPAGLDSPAARLEAFRRTLEGVDGKVRVVADEAAAAAALAEIVRESGAGRVARSDAPLVVRLLEGLADVEAFPAWEDRPRLLEAELGVSAAQHGIAETGTLVLRSDRERHRLASLVPPVHVAVLEAADIVATLGDALAVVDDADGPPPLVTFITGPSRTGDIELTIVVGVHGPRELHVIVIDR